MALQRIGADEALADLGRFDAVIDARSESEFALDRLPGAVNWPTLNDAERHAVGLAYQQDSPFEARKRGAAMAARNIAAHLDTHGPGLPRGWRPLVYCWRGGQRSGALATVLAAIGFDVHVLDGGYRAFRRQVLAALDSAGDGFTWRVLCGPTGSGKSRLLQALAQVGAQVLDLEALACHRGSVLGALPDAPQPSQKHFETLVWHALDQFDRARPVFVESESRLVGRLRVPEALLQHMRAAACVRVTLSTPARVSLLMDEYAHFVADAGQLCERLSALRELRGAERVASWQAMARNGQMQQLVQELLEQHYDPMYHRSMGLNYAGLPAAVDLTLADGSAASFEAAARRLIAP